MSSDNNISTNFHTIALVGHPNCGKSAMFNRLTGAHQKVANYAGVTVDCKQGDTKASLGLDYHVIDLPGVYSLNPLSEDEAITKNALTGNSDLPTINALVHVIDATNLLRSLPLLLEVIQLGYPTVLALNMTDLARKKGQIIDLNVLQAQLGIPVIETSAIRSNGLQELFSFLSQHHNQSSWLKPSNIGSDQTDVFARAHEIYQVAVEKQADTYSLTQKIDRFVLHPILGLPILLFVLFFIFQAVFTWARWPMSLIEQAIISCSQYADFVLANGPFKSLVIDGIIAGTGSILVFLPQILILFFFILVLEESGYLPRAAFILDAFMRKIGISGHAFIPLLSSFACAVPGIMATRTIRNERDRIITILIAPLMTCSARLPVYSLIISAFIPRHNLGLFNLQGLVLFGMYIVGIVFAAIASIIFSKTMSSKEYQPFLMELPAYHYPRLRSILAGLLERAYCFLKRIATVIFATAIIIWFISTYPIAPADFTGSPIEYSLAGRIGQCLTFIFEPIGFNWQIVVSLIPGMAAREITVSVLGTVYALSTANHDITSALTHILSISWHLPTALALLAWFVFAPQCFATISTIRQETGSNKIMFFAVGYLFALAYFAAFLTYHISNWILGGM